MAETKANTYTGTIEVSDGVVSYRAELKGQWTLTQIQAAFADGHDTGEADEGADFECEIRQVIFDPENEDVYNLISVDGFTLTCDGNGGVVERGEYPHRVSWSG